MLFHYAKKTEKSAKEILGPVDAMKLRSCATLFGFLKSDPVFDDIIKTFYNGKRCQKTLSEIQKT